MGTKLVSMKCPECNAALNVEEGRKQIFCSYCGTKIIIDNDNEYVYRHIDEAKIKRVETEQLLRLREMELEEKERDRSRKSKRIAYIVAGVLFLVGLLTFAIVPGFVGLFMVIAGALIAEFTFLGGQKNKRVIRSNEVQITEEMCDCEDKNYNSAVALYQAMGFINVKAIPLCDLNFLTSRKNGRVDEITINGNDDFDEGDIFLKTDRVTITYHSLNG